MNIRNAGIAEIPLIRRIAYETWPVAYRDIIPPAQIAYMLELLYSENALEQQMEKGHRFIIASDEDVAVGFASFSSHIDNSFKLHKLYVLPGVQVKGCGSALLHYVTEFATRADAATLVLNVNKYNPAKEFYKKHGFTILADEVIDIGEGYVMDDYVMQKALRL